MPKNGGFIDFLPILGCETHFKSELHRNQLDRHREAAYEIFSIERRFRRSKVRFFHVQGNLRTQASKSGTPIKVVILPLLASLS